MEQSPFVLNVWTIGMASLLLILLLMNLRIIQQFYRFFVVKPEEIAIRKYRRDRKYFFSPAAAFVVSIVFLLVMTMNDIYLGPLLEKVDDINELDTFSAMAVLGSFFLSTCSLAWWMFAVFKSLNFRAESAHFDQSPNAPEKRMFLKDQDFYYHFIFILSLVLFIVRSMMNILMGSKPDPLTIILIVVLTLLLLLKRKQLSRGIFTLDDLLYKLDKRNIEERLRSNKTTEGAS